MPNVKICLDAGHYGKYTCNKNVTPTYWESLMAWELHLMLKEELERFHGVTVLTTREKEEVDLEVVERGQKAKGCDLLISLHSNDCDTESVDRPVCIYPVSGACKELAEKLAASVKDTMQTKDAWRVYSRWNSSHTADYYGVIRGAVSVGVPGLIIEHSFHTHNKSAAWLNVDANLKELAKAEAVCLAVYFGLDVDTKLPFVDVPDGKYYTDAVKWAWSEGLVEGTDATHFKPNAQITRGQLVTILFRYHDKFGGG